MTDLSIQETLSFLRELRQNNNREWFHSRKADCDALRVSFTRQIDALIALVAQFDEELLGLSAKSCIYRIYRDTRFSLDKTPYKTFFSAYLARGGKQSPRAGYYLHIEPEGCLIGGGIWCPESHLLRNLREAVYHNIDEFLEIIEQPDFKAAFPRFEGEVLKTVPRGFPKEWEHAHWLKRKDYTVVTPISEHFFDAPNWIEACAERFRLLKPLNDFLNFTVDETL